MCFKKPIQLKRFVITSKYQNPEIVLSGNIMKTSTEGYLKSFYEK